MISIYLENEQASEQFASSLANVLVSGTILAFHGDIGAGKTTIIRATLKNLGITSAIKSPTFSLVESYSTEHFELHHFDLYRIHNPEELDYLGFRDYFTAHSICIIEWAERAKGVLPKIDLRFTLENDGAGRRLQIIAETDVGKHLLTGLEGKV